MKDFLEFATTWNYAAWIAVNGAVTAFIAVVLGFTKLPKGLQIGILVNVAFALGALGAFLPLL